jgi:hypothetical protein
MMKKTIAVLVVLLLAAASAEAAFLMNETFDTAAQQVDVDTLPGWVNNNGSSVEWFRTTQVSDAVDGGTLGIEKKQSGGSWGSYSYDISHTLGAGESYRFEAYLEAQNGHTDTAHNLRIYHSDGRRTQFYFDGAAELDWAIYDAGSSKIHNANVSTSSLVVRVALDIGPDGVTAWYDLSGGTSWVSLGDALATSNSDFGFDGIGEVNSQMYTAQTASKVRADSFSLTTIPEPSTLALLALGSLAALFRRKR